MPTSLLEKLQARRSPQGIIALSAAKAYGQRDYFEAATEKFAAMDEGETTKYVVGCMQPIEPHWTQATLDEGQRVGDQLRAALPAHGFRVEFDFQGSVTNLTHIKWHSDLDLLVIDPRFVRLEPPQKAASPYGGVPVNDLKQLRDGMVKVVRRAFPNALINQTGAKSVSVANGELSRKMDLIVCNWWNTNDYARTNEKRFRGVSILDLSNDERINNKPFLHNSRIAARDERVNGGLRKAIRFLKSLKYDLKVPLSSYDIASISYHVPEGMLAVPKGKELVLAENLLRYLKSLDQDSSARTALLVPNGMRNVFCEEGATVEGLRRLMVELSNVLTKAKVELAGSFRTLNEAVLSY